MGWGKVVRVGTTLRNEGKLWPGPAVGTMDQFFASSARLHQGKYKAGGEGVFSGGPGFSGRLQEKQESELSVMSMRIEGIGIRYLQQGD